MPVVSLEPLPQPAALAAGTVTGIEGGDADAGVDVDVPVAPVPPPQATSVVKSNADHTCFIASVSSWFRPILITAIATVFYIFRQSPTCFRTGTRANTKREVEVRVCARAIRVAGRRSVMSTRRHVLPDDDSGDFYSLGPCSEAVRSKPLKLKRILALAQTLQLICQKKTGAVPRLSTEETMMNSSMKRQSTRHLLPGWKIDRFVLLGVCLIALTAVLFYGAVLLVLWRELR
jgi:hypothetical protein